MLLTDIFEEAYEQAGLREAKNGFDVRKLRRSLQLLQMDWDNRGLNFWRIAAYSANLTAATASYNTTTDTVDLLDVSVKDGSTGSETLLSRIDIGEYQSISTKTTPGRPTQLFVLRGQTMPVAYLWPVPDKSTYILTGWKMVTDATAGAVDTSAVFPNRFLPALVSGLAYEIGKKSHPQEVSDSKLAQLKADYDEKWLRAEKGDVQRAPIYLRPNLRGYA